MAKNHLQAHPTDGKRFLKFTSLKSAQIITTVDFGSYRTEEIFSKKNGFYGILQIFFQTDEFLLIKPEHKDRVFWLNNRMPSGAINCDGLIYYDIRNGNPQKTLTAATGDCPYVLIEGYNSEIRAIALVHSGWRGTSLNIVGKTINAMFNTGIKSVDLKIGVLSGICQNCYEVDRPVFEAFTKKIRDTFFKATKPNHWLLDLKSIIKSQIKDTGFNPKMIETINACPHCFVDDNGKHLLFSNRRGEIQRNLICMKL